jgi:hypothetical protein
MLKTSIRLTPLSIVIFYACVGGIWLIFSSAQIFTSLFHKHPTSQLVEINNIFFILISSWLLYYFIRKSESGITNREKALSRLNRALKTYSECRQSLIRDENEMQLMQNVCRTIVETGGYRVAWVGMAENDAERTIKPVAQWGDNQGYLKNLNVSWSNRDLGRGPTGTAIKTGKPVVVQFIEYDPKW